MSDLEKRVHDAFDAIAVPDGLNERTLRAIEQARLQQEADTSRKDCPSEQPVPRFKTVSVRHWRRTVAALAACLIVAVVGFMGYRWYNEPTAYVGIDVNPSLEMQLNRFGVVVSAQGLNPDGVYLLEEVSLVGKTYQEAMQELTESEAFAPYATADAFVEISITCDNVKQEEQLRMVSDESLQKLPCEGRCETVTTEERQAAQEVGLGVGRYRAAQELMQLDSSLTLEDCSAMTMRQLRDRIEALGGIEDFPAPHKGDGGGSGEGSHDGHGSGAGNGSGNGAGNANGNGNGNGNGSGFGTGKGSDAQ